MSALTVYLESQATEPRCREVLAAALSGRPLTSDECDVLNGMVAKLFDSPAPDGFARALDLAEDAVQDAIAEVENIRISRLEDALDRLNDLRRAAA